MEKTKKVLKNHLDKIKLSNEEIGEIKKLTNELIKKLNSAIKSLKISANIFVGGSVAKGTIIRKSLQDVDIFIRFHNKKDLTKLEKIIKKRNISYKIVKGSRNYIRIKQGNNLVFEIIPVLKVPNPKKAENVTDLSYFHVNYVLKKLKNKKRLADDILLAKSFAHASGCYGAESYIKGFSGYALELLVIYYRGFLNMIKKLKDINDKKRTIIDAESHYKGKNVLYELNESKLESPVVFIDPTFKERNALAALSNETFRKFQKACKKFLKSPSIRAFEEEEINKETLRIGAKKKNLEFGIINIKTNKQVGDIAGTKLLKFSKFLQQELARYFSNIKIKFEYDNKQSAKVYFTGKKIKETIRSGPYITNTNHLIKFKKKHKQAAFIKNHQAFAKVKLNISLKQALDKLKKIHKTTIKEMSIISVKLS